MKILDLKKFILSVSFTGKNVLCAKLTEQPSLTQVPQKHFLPVFFARVFGLKGLGSVDILVHSDFQVQIAPTIQSLIITELFYLCN